ncbi:nuclear transport factor 2 family protein [Micromonospora lupini]|uniref:Hydroxylacyl-CoA dehydrogenase n=1 Tax=Micromonospora lupini str. Lupac 08 TaxID=1150864 RepID=I0L7G2_9ACTN|nr:nuclear transport factor 2 family protein [Micromonospora lupini]CCH19759.1 Hydroxylacyl-CoA dehydrogenase [Micromonospora lupini str. Lupac 08]
MTTTQPTGSTAHAVDAGTYAEILQFYARHFQLLDEGQAEQWSQQFTEDGEFGQNVKPEPRRGRTAIAASMRRGIDRLAESGLTRRHWYGNVIAEPDGDDAVRTRYYATVFETPPGGGAARVYLSTTAEDLLHRQDGEWFVHRRHIVHDGT